MNINFENKRILVTGACQGTYFENIPLKEKKMKIKSKVRNLKNLKIEMN